MSDQNQDWWSEGVRFTCMQCGRCCREEPGAVWFTEDEAEAMAAFLGISMAEFHDRYVWKRYGKLSLREKPNYDCIFLDRSGETERCAIYEHRPSQCRTFPFWPDVLKTELSWESYSQTCPGMNCGKFHDRAAILEQLSRNET